MIYPPDLKNGNFLQTEKSLHRAIGIYPFNLRQIKLIHAIIDKTYGWGKAKDDISVSQLSEMTGIQENHCSSAIKSLVSLNVITKEKGKYAYKIGINKFFRDWQGWDTSWEYWNKSESQEQPEPAREKPKPEPELTHAQVACWEWAKMQDYWQDKVPTQADFLKLYSRNNSGVKTQYEEFVKKSAARTTAAENKFKTGFEYGQSTQQQQYFKNRSDVATALSGRHGSMFDSHGEETYSETNRGNVCDVQNDVLEGVDYSVCN